MRYPLRPAMSSPTTRPQPASNLDDLLRPSLKPEDDQPLSAEPFWNPASIVFASFFVGPIGSAMLVRMNALRLDVRDAYWVLAGLPLLAYLYLQATGMPEDASTLKLLLRVAQIALTFWATRSQMRPYQVRLNQGRTPHGMFLFGVLAFVVNLAGLMAIAYLDFLLTL